MAKVSAVARRPRQRLTVDVGRGRVRVAAIRLRLPLDLRRARSTSAAMTTVGHLQGPLAPGPSDCTPCAGAAALLAVSRSRRAVAGGPRRSSPTRRLAGRTVARRLSGTAGARLVPLSMATTATSVAEICAQAKALARARGARPPSRKNRALEAMADALEAREAEILEANERDMEAGRENDLSACAARPAPSSRRSAGGHRRRRARHRRPARSGRRGDRRAALPNGLDMRKVRVPLGVVAVVYEARPNVTIDCSALCLKSGNAIVLRGSSIAAHSNAVLAAVAQAVAAAGCPRVDLDRHRRRPRRAAPDRHPGRPRRSGHSRAAARG